MSMIWWKNVSSLSKRLMMTAFVLVTLVVILSIGTLMPISQSEAQATDKQLTDQVNYLGDNGLLVPYIFGNNLMITLIMFIPFVGPIFGAYVIFNTGTIIAARSVAEGIPPLFWVGALLVNPIFWLEFAAYSLAVSASIWLTLRIFQHRTLHELSNTTKFVTISAVLLLAGAIVETAEIMLMR